MAITNPYEVKDGNDLKITNSRLAENKIYTKTGKDNKRDYPDPGKIEYLAKGLTDTDATGEFIIEKNDGIPLQLYRVNTSVTIPAATTSEAGATVPGEIRITPTLTEEIVYYVKAVAELNKIYVDADDNGYLDITTVAQA